jgi:phosphoglycerate dehydrogenase-like enzyme
MAGADDRPGLAFAFTPLAVADLFVPGDLTRLARHCTIIEATPLARFDDERARRVLAKTQILVAGWGCPRLDAAVLAMAPDLRLVAYSGGSVKTLVSPGLFARGIRLVAAADANALPVAEFTVAAILFANKRVLDFAALYKRERRGLNLYLSVDHGVGNYGRTVGIVGASRIGRRVIELLRPFDLKLLLADPFVSAAAARELGVELVPLAELLQLSDVVSVHAPSLPETRHLIDAAGLASLRDGAVLVNTSRGALIDQQALIAELETGRISAVLDVTEPDILPAESPLYELPNVLLTPHIAGAMGDEHYRLGRLVTDEVERFMRGEPLRYELDPTNLDRQA